jgi:hypothetical protein
MDCVQFARKYKNKNCYILGVRITYYVSGHYPSFCLYVKTPSCLFFKIKRFGDWILSPSSGKTYSLWPN